MNEIMTGSVDTRSVVSKMTLALLEDSGWYKANYSMADRLDWGRNQGTEFVTFPCNLWKGAYRCNTTQFSGCTYNREAEGYCPILTYSGDLPQWAQYFPQANKGMLNHGLICNIQANANPFMISSCLFLVCYVYVIFGKILLYRRWLLDCQEILKPSRLLHSEFLINSYCFCCPIPITHHRCSCQYFLATVVNGFEH